MKKITFLGLVLLSLQAFGQTPQAACSFNYSSTAKPCPTSGSTLLDDTYPVASYVISISPQRETRNSPPSFKVPADFVLNTLRAHGFNPNSPNIIIPASAQTFDELKNELSRRIAASNGAIPASVLDKLQNVPASGPVSANMTWQQDYFESFFDPATGRPVIRQIESYDDETARYPRVNSNATQAIADSTRGCGISNGPKIDYVVRPAAEALPNGAEEDGSPDSNGNTYSFRSGEMGGNIEGLPGGLCLVGDNQGSVFSNQFCRAEDTVQINVSWLSVGHVDEVVKVIPTNRPGVPAECNFSLMFASPRKARELLRDPARSNHPLFSGSFIGDSATQEQLNEFRDSRSALGRSNSTSGVMCRLMDIIEPTRNPQNAPGKSKGGSSSGSQAFNYIKELLLPTAHAANEPLKKPRRVCNVETITNSEFLRALEVPRYKDFNDEVDKVMDRNKQLIIAKILERLPQCRPYLAPIDVPNLFFGNLRTNSDGTKSLTRDSSGDAFMPNPTNSVIANRDVMFSDPQNPIFREYLASQLRPLGLNSQFIDTWDYSHLGNGNLHCSSHSIPYCSPSTGGRR